VGVWFITQLIFLAFQLVSLVFSIVLWTQLGLPHPLVARILWCVCTHLINLMGIHLLYCVHGNEWARTHDVVCDIFTTIVWDVSFQMGQRQFHALPSNMFNPSCQWINIMLTKDNICILAYVVIVTQCK